MSAYSWANIAAGQIGGGPPVIGQRKGWAGEAYTHGGERGRPFYGVGYETGLWEADQLVGEVMIHCRCEMQSH